MLVSLTNSMLDQLVWLSHLTQRAVQPTGLRPVNVEKVSLDNSVNPAPLAINVSFNSEVHSLSVSNVIVRVILILVILNLVSASAIITLMEITVKDVLVVTMEMLWMEHQMIVRNVIVQMMVLVCCCRMALLLVLNVQKGTKERSVSCVLMNFMEIQLKVSVVRSVNVMEMLIRMPSESVTRKYLFLNYNGISSIPLLNFYFLVFPGNVTVVSTTLLASTVRIALQVSGEMLSLNPREIVNLVTVTLQAPNVHRMSMNSLNVPNLMANVIVNRTLKANVVTNVKLASSIWLLELAVKLAIVTQLEVWTLPVMLSLELVSVNLVLLAANVINVLLITSDSALKDVRLVIVTKLVQNPLNVTSTQVNVCVRTTWKEEDVTNVLRTVMISVEDVWLVMIVTNWFRPERTPSRPVLELWRRIWMKFKTIQWRLKMLSLMRK